MDFDEVITDAEGLREIIAPPNEVVLTIDVRPLVEDPTRGAECPISRGLP